MPEADTAHSAVITEHAFVAELWWDACAICGLSMAAHRAVLTDTLSSMEVELSELPYRCPACVWASEFRKAEPHKGECPHGESSS